MARHAQPSEPDLTPDDIRRIRETLGLSQAEAGELLGGGPRAFTKYENGTIKPAAAVSNLLRLVDRSPGAATALLGRRVTPMAAQGLGPFKVSGQHVAVLTERKLVLLTRKLINAEALCEGIGMDRIHVASNINEPDGGEDGRIEWSEGPERTRFLPSRLCQFQMKATEIDPAEAAEDVIDSAGAVKAMVHSVLSNGGTYVMMCGRSYTSKKIESRVKAIVKRLAAAGLTVPASQVQFRDADQIADWVNIHPSVAAWLLQETQPGLVGPFRDWLHWAGRHEYDSSPWVTDDRLDAFREKLRGLIEPVRGVARIAGLSGRGKSRLTLEALGPTTAEELSRVRLCDLVLYAVEQEAGAETVKGVVQNLVDARVRAIVVIDRCPQESHRDLAAMVKRSDSRLSLVTIDHEIPRGDALPADTILVDAAPASVIEGMLKQVASRASNADRPRLVRLASGFPQLARLIGEAWLQDISIASAPDTVLFDRILLGRNRADAAQIETSAMLLSAFGLVGVKPPVESDLETIAPFGSGTTTADLRRTIDDLVARGVAQLRGRLVALQPRPVALHLAERQWRAWDRATWDHVLFGPIPARLRKQAAEQLAMLNALPISVEVVRHVCRRGGPIDSIGALSVVGNAEVISSLAEIDTDVVVALLERVLDGAGVSALRAIEGDSRRHLVWALEKVAFVQSTFERGALLLFELAMAENESWGNNASGQFKALFPVLLGNTEAGADDRLMVIDELLRTNDLERLKLVVHALQSGAKADSFTRSLGIEIHGSRPAMEPWRPQLWSEAWSYVRECANRLAVFAKRSDDIGEIARDALAGQFRMYVGRGLIDDVERWVLDVTLSQSYWPKALTSLGDVLQYDRDELEPDVARRVQSLVERLSPDDVASKVRFIVSEMPWDYPVDEKLDFEERGKRQSEAVQALADELLGDEKLLIAFFPELSTGSQRMSIEFGRALALGSQQPLDLKQPIIDALLAVATGQRNYGLLSGYLWGLATVAPTTFDSLKEQFAVSADLAPAFALSSWYAELSSRDVELMCHALRLGVMPAFALRSWVGGGKLAKLTPDIVGPLFDSLFSGPPPFYGIGLELFGMYVFQHRDRLDMLRPQIRQAAANLKHAEKHRGGSHMDQHNFDEVMKWILAKGNNDRDAAAVALNLAQHLVDDPNEVGQDYIRPLLPQLLKTFAHITWPIIGQAIVSDRQKEWRLQLTLGDSFAFDNVKKPMIVHLPEDMLFAWCHAHPEVAPAFVAGVVSVLTHRDREAPPPDLDPLARRLLDEFGEREDVLSALVSNMHSFGWSGSRTGYFKLYEQPLKSLGKHPIGAVRRWAKRMLVSMQREFEAARDEDDELRASWGE